MVSQGESHSDSESDEKVFGASSQSYNSHGWVVDSGASSHTAQEFLVNYEDFDNPQKVSMGDGCTVEAHGRGNIHFKMILENNIPRKVTMCNVLYVPKLTCNLFSVRATVTMGNTVKFENGSCRIYDRNGLLLGTESLFDKLYYLKYESITQEYVSVISGQKQSRSLASTTRTLE